MESYLAYLAAQARAERVAVSEPLDAALASLDRDFAALAPALQVEYFGPGVGVDADRSVFRLAVGPHRGSIEAPVWGLRVCDGTASGGWRPMWAVQGVGRLRKVLVVKALPELLAGFAEAVAAAGKSDTAAGRRVHEMAAAFEV
ncbi:MAG TPA: hypothetical protein VKA76_00660 [Gammaproteobacteria bacterium]|nr:hypothetical protein [Gammaproteobacteria bacterium]